MTGRSTKSDIFTNMGEGVATDYAQARYWYKLAAAQGNEAAKDALRRLPDE